jgi:hypothetical protein
MKIRTGFVSNSSSSNFIVSTNAYKTVFDLALAMIKIRDEDYVEWSDSERLKYLTESKNILREIIHGKDPDTPIYFSSCNYDTYIKRVCDGYVVATCNNHRFLNQIDGIIDCPEDIKEWLKDNEYYKDYEEYEHILFLEKFQVWEFTCGEVFWSPKYDLNFSRFDDFSEWDKGKGDHESFCSKKGHFSEFFILESTKQKICPVCYTKEQEEKREPTSRFDILDLDSKNEKMDG